ncbi:GTP-binding protein Era [Caldicellulosiruptor owensensis OL]|uniref:GTPase Era n=1 Tax=Caldicellulosiruptor owensensis (strain ATCC 700167 / DSM 13100 / OL) TaxID=632518 RepID=E4Q1L4_CALOW|nr:GTPase Era [Caldicellulosiruptor owensensis]ADQ04748.1 GTP-binding protein Era [Caldicellulosiruptor owensensis OL]
MAFKSGFVALIGRPNVGKSTLMNYLVGKKISIISPKPQTTRNSIKGILTLEDAQIIFIDTPGVHPPKNKLGEYMVKVSEKTLKEVDLILYIVEAIDNGIGPWDEAIVEKLKEVETPKILVLNKSDLASKENIEVLKSIFSAKLNFESIIDIAAINGYNCDLLLNEIKELLPEGPKYYLDDMTTDVRESFIVAEIIREKILLNLSEEVPHGVGIAIERFAERENKDILDIEAIIYCEKDSHKAIIIGKGGQMLKKIGMQAREELEMIFGMKVNLQLWVKVKKNWRDDISAMKMLGYNLKEV